MIPARKRHLRLRIKSRRMNVEGQTNWKAFDDKEKTEGRGNTNRRYRKTSY